MTLPGIPMLALAPGQVPGTGQVPGCPATSPRPAASTPTASAFDRAREGWLIDPPHRGPPRHRHRPRPTRGVTFPASSVRLDAYDAWLSHVWSAAACSHPVQLHGTVQLRRPLLPARSPARSAPTTCPTR